MLLCCQKVNIWLVCRWDFWARNPKPYGSLYIVLPYYMIKPLLNKVLAGKYKGDTVSSNSLQLAITFPIGSLKCIIWVIKDMFMCISNLYSFCHLDPYFIVLCTIQEHYLRREISSLYTCNLEQHKTRTKCVIMVLSKDGMVLGFLFTIFRWIWKF